MPSGVSPEKIKMPPGVVTCTIRVPSDFSTEAAEICLSRPEAKEQFGERPDGDCLPLLPRWLRKQVSEPAYPRQL